jgi:hypothetical protein
MRTTDTMSISLPPGNRYAYVLGNPTGNTDSAGLGVSRAPYPDPPVSCQQYLINSNFTNFPGYATLCGALQSALGPTVFYGGYIGGGSSSGVASNACSVSSSTLNRYLQQKSSPIYGQGQNLFNAGQTYNVDPRLVVALAGAESTFGTNITWGAYNAWNWGWNTKNQSNSPFSGWPSAITSVTKGLAGKNYLGGGNTNTTSIYVNNYCHGACKKGLDNLNSFLTEQGGDATSLGFPCGGGH